MSKDHDRSFWRYLPLPRRSQIALLITVAAVVVVESAVFAESSASAGQLNRVLVVASMLCCMLVAWKPPVAALVLLIPAAVAAGNGFAGPVLVAVVASALIGLTCEPRLTYVYTGAVLVLCAVVTAHPASVLLLQGGLLFGILAVGASALGIVLHRQRRRMRTLSTQLAHERQNTDQERRQERLLIADELHDVVAHEISLITMYARVLRLTPEEDHTARAHALETIEAEASQALASIRHLVRATGGDEDAPFAGWQEQASTAPSPIASVLETCRTELEQRGITVDDDVPADVRLGRATELTLARVAREATLNILKHAPTTSRVRFALIPNGDQVTLTVWNTATAGDGLGIPHGGYGLTRMRERATLLGGAFRAGNADGGWEISVSVPRR